MKRNGSYFLDTAYILALFNVRDAYHKKAKDLFPLLDTAKEVWLAEAVLTEVGNALSCINRLAAVSFIQSCYDSPATKVVTVDKKLFFRAVDLYHKYFDKEWGLTDCISFVVMQDHGLTEAFTTDEHFIQM